MHCQNTLSLFSNHQMVTIVQYPDDRFLLLQRALVHCVGIVEVGRTVFNLTDPFVHLLMSLIIIICRENLYDFGKYVRDNNLEPYYTISRLKKITKQVPSCWNRTHCCHSHANY